MPDLSLPTFTALCSAVVSVGVAADAEPAKTAAIATAIRAPRGRWPLLMFVPSRDEQRRGPSSERGADDVARKPRQVELATEVAVAQCQHHPRHPLRTTGGSARMTVRLRQPRGGGFAGSPAPRPARRRGS